MEEAVDYEQQIQDILQYILYKHSERIMAHGEIPHGAVMVEGVMTAYGFHPTRLDEKKPDILELVNALVGDQFMIDIGGGASFAGLARIQDTEEQWTEHIKIAEALFMLASGVGLAGFSAPYEMWDQFPEGVPYVWFRRSEDVEIATIQMPQTMN